MRLYSSNMFAGIAIMMWHHYLLSSQRYYCYTVTDVSNAWCRQLRLFGLCFPTTLSRHIEWLSAPYCNYRRALFASMIMLWFMWYRKIILAPSWASGKIPEQRCSSHCFPLTPRNTTLFRRHERRQLITCCRIQCRMRYFTATSIYSSRCNGMVPVRVCKCVCNDVVLCIM